MRYYAFFHDFDLAGNLAEACGDRSVVRIDGRLTSEAMHAIAADECKRRGYVAYQIHKGDALSRAESVGALVRVDSLTDLQTISRRMNSTP